MYINLPQWMEIDTNTMMYGKSINNTTTVHTLRYSYAVSCVTQNDSQIVFLSVMTSAELQRNSI